MEIFLNSSNLNKGLNLDDILSNLKTNFIGNRLIYKFCVDSTNNVAKRYLKKGFSKNGDIFLADKQTKGRGRKDSRIWESGKMQNIILSILITNLVFSLPMITLIVGIVVMDALKEITSLDVKVKWPNDVYINGKKVSGILCEMVHFKDNNSLIIGIGVNVNSHGFSNKIKDSSTSLYLEAGKYFSREKIICKILNKLETYITDCNLDIENFIEKYKKNCININKKIIFYSENEVEIFGKIINISNDGELMVISSNGNVVSINSSYQIKYLES